MEQTVTDSCNLAWQLSQVSRATREQRHGHPGMILWLTGLSGSGKSTLAYALEATLHALGGHTFVLDGDNIRHGLCRDLGFSAADRQENIRRIGEVAHLFAEAGLITIAAFISPFQADRQLARSRAGQHHFVEIYCRCPLAVCEQRDVKGLYQKARAGLIRDFTGISSPYEEPTQADIIVDTATLSIAASVNYIMQQIHPLLTLYPNSAKKITIA
ncbi:MAG: adenylyl-sulfate kinase [Magnetococcales bacterium]|nr:adenylyl-sulfate kinase [Magnetococcales bacterium]